ncbi:MAG: UDP-glucose--hexose-1-phosphate uridylyltransferase [Paenibacillaceae bacterium]|nr:UDP-glucose--hexose-1-phosphate uridylyltransferase [Paenibacillaceae bacterium]
MTSDQAVGLGSESEEIRGELERLLAFAVRERLLERADVVAARNALLDLFGIAEPLDEAASDAVWASAAPDSAVPMLERLLDYALTTGLLPDNTTTQRDLLDTRIMGLLMPRQSEIERRFLETERQFGIAQATDDYYRLSIASSYIRMDRIRKNDYWLTPTAYGELEITVNLSKPEKDPTEIAAERSAPQSHYPKCLLCVENVGYAGRVNHPARQNHRVIPVELDESAWYMQYSPYVYYNEHCIVFSGKHSPMRISAATFERLLDFIGRFPHYFVGSNADLPIVGGSILNHDHFQGGRHVFPMEKAPVERTFVSDDHPGVAAGIVRWPMSVIRLAGDEPAALLRAASHILDAWRGYSDPAADIVAFSSGSGAGGDPAPHNTITPIARRSASGGYELDLVLRNNRTTAEHPFGLFHPHEPLHHIKKENIGLIEVMGLAVLPGRLQQEMAAIRRMLTGVEALPADWAQQPGHPLYKHAAWIARLTAAAGTAMSDEEAAALLRREVGDIFLQVLEDAGVYKRTVGGQAAFDRLFDALGYRPFATTD